jgi:hypothetical protein
MDEELQRWSEEHSHASDEEFDYGYADCTSGSGKGE